ncbi:MAG: prolyl oligopeptidase family serine peptidase [Cryomorphaceae bacterium]
MKFSPFAILFFCLSANAQVMTPEMLWTLGRVSPIGLTEDESALYYKVTRPDVEANSYDSKILRYSFKDGTTAEVDEANGVKDADISPDGKWKISIEKVKLLNVSGSDLHGDLPESHAYRYDDLHHRHWDTWRDGRYNHLVISPISGNGEETDIMEGEKFDCPTVPFGGSEDYTWNHDGSEVTYVCKKLTGAAYMNSTNTDIYSYNISTGKTVNLTADNPGYDTQPLYAKNGTLAWLSMARDGYEKDKNDIKVRLGGKTVNLTTDWDGTVNEFIWSDDAKTLYFTAPVSGTEQLFSVALPGKNGKPGDVQQITEGPWNVTGIVAQRGKKLIAGRTDMNHAKELYEIDLKNGEMKQLTHVNDEAYESIALSKIEARKVETADGKQMHVWVIYPPNFDPSKKYPTLLYTQGGPQSALSQFYSFRWNFQVMAAHGYIVVAPNRRGMPGHGVAWNEQISKDWGGHNMQDYLDAIDALAEEPYVDENRLGCVGASYGGYSAFYLAGTHEGRFETFIAHAGIFNLRSMYGNTEELFFVNWDTGGPYWEKDNAAAQKSYSEFNPIDRVGDWDTPILIIQGGKDYRVPEGQALEAFTAAQQLGVKSRLLYFPDENHWVLNPQSALVWQREFFGWLDETLKQ